MGNTLSLEPLEKSVDLSSKELPSEKFYHYLKTSYDNINQYYGVCRTIDSKYNTDSTIINICGKLVKYLKTNYEEVNKEHLRHHHCNLLSHWLYEQLDEHFKDNFNKTVSVYAEFKRILSHVFNDHNESQANECLREVHVFALNNWKDRKELYDYCVDYDKIKELADSSNEKFKEYKEYIQKKSRLYEKFESLYSLVYKSENIDFYKKCKSYKPENVIPTLKYEEKFSEQENLKSVARDPVLLGSTQYSGQNSDSTNTYGNVLLGVVVTSMTSGVLYKFTPLGRRLRNGFGWNNYTAGNLNDGGNMSFAQTHDPFSPLSEEREHHIGYLPA